MREICMADLPALFGLEIPPRFVGWLRNMATQDIITLKLRIVGSVQGVGYRAFAVGEARGLGLQGWVRNCRDGTVEALASGPRATVEAFVAACARGPSGAQVHNIEWSEAEAAPEPGFHLRQSQ